MGTWQLIKELAKGAGFYTRQFIFFVTVFTLIVVAVIYINRRYYSANGLYDESSTFGNNERAIELRVTKDGKVISNKHLVSRIEIGQDKDTLRYKILDEPNEFINSLQVKVHFDSEIPAPPSTEHEVKATHYDTGDGSSVSSYYADSHTIIFLGRSLSPTTIFTIYARFPKGVIQPSFSRSLANRITNLSFSFWLMLALSLPLINLLILGFMFYRRWLSRSLLSTAVVKKPPSDLPPALVGVLVHGRIGPREITSTLIDLSLRGYIHLYESKQGFFFGRGRGLETEKIFELKPFERVLLAKIFLPGEATASVSQINLRLGRHLFSRRIAQAFLEIYNAVSAKKYFITNPVIIHQKYKLLGLILLFAGLLGFLINAIFNQKAPFLLLFWAGMIGTAALIVYFSPYMPSLTPSGKKARNEWLAFRRFLTQNAEIPFAEKDLDTYLKYLPYAIVLGVETNWTMRWFEIPFTVPRWYGSYKQISSIEDFANHLFPLVGYVGQDLFVNKTPVVE